MHVKMLGFIYLVMILCWILIVLFLKCRKILKPHFVLSDNHNEESHDGIVERRPSVHVIQLSAEDIENEEQQMEAYHQRSHSLRRYSNRSHCSSTIDERPTDRTYPIDAVINPAYNHDEEYIINAPPPSYDEVMRQPEVYPQIHRKLSGGKFL